MVSVHDLDALEVHGGACGIHEHALKRFRIAFFKKGLAPAECLATLPETARERFAAQVLFDQLALVERRDSSIDGATKLLFRAADGHRVEAVILRIASGRTSLCISSQIGCGADCAFCATGRMGFARNLSAHEMLDQVVLAMRLLRAEGRRLRNVVFMGMGEPFHNEKALCAALDVLRDPRGFHLAERHLLVSTVGVTSAMVRFVERFPDMRLALSLHSARQEVRERIMPTAGFHALEKIHRILPVVSAHRNFMVEVLLLKGVNDGPEDLAALIDFLRGTPAHINLIQFNPFPGAPFQPVTRAAREAFGAALRREGFKVTLRYSLGDDIAAACGQLAGQAGA
jgi:23S rRNA (adenine2503-C2)-methyltransferase